MKCHIHISATYKVLNMLEIIKEKKKKWIFGSAWFMNVIYGWIKWLFISLMGNEVVIIPNVLSLCTYNNVTLFVCIK